jgi:hypothetical protein
LANVNNVFVVSKNVLVWNVCGLNVNGHCDVEPELVTVERPSIVRLKETMYWLSIVHRDVVLNDFYIIQLLGAGFDYAYLLVVQTNGNPCGVAINNLVSLIMHIYLALPSICKDAPSIRWN